MWTLNCKKRMCGFFYSNEFDCNQSWWESRSVDLTMSRNVRRNMLSGSINKRGKGSRSMRPSRLVVADGWQSCSRFVSSLFLQNVERQEEKERERGEDIKTTSSWEGMSKGRQWPRRRVEQRVIFHRKKRVQEFSISLLPLTVSSFFLS